jgi:hypothetical protein
MLIYLWIISIIITRINSQYFTYNLDDPNEVPSCTREKPQLISLFYTSQFTCWKIFGGVLSYLPDDEQLLFLYSMGNNTDTNTCFNYTFYISGLRELRLKCAQGIKTVYESFSTLYRYSMGCIENYINSIPINDLITYEMVNRTLSSMLFSQSMQSSYSAIFLKTILDLQTSRRRWFFQKKDIVDRNCVKKNDYCEYFPFSQPDLKNVINSFQNLLRITYFHNLNTNLNFLKFQSSMVQSDECFTKKSSIYFEQTTGWLLNQAYIKIQSEFNSTEKYIRTNHSTKDYTMDFLKIMKKNLIINSTIFPLPELQTVLLSLLVNDNNSQILEYESLKVKLEYPCYKDYFFICGSSMSNTCFNYTDNSKIDKYTLKFIHNKIFDYYFAVGCLDTKRFLYIYMNSTMGEEFQFFKKNGNELGNTLITEMNTCVNGIISTDDKVTSKCIGDTFNSKCTSSIKSFCYGDIGYFHLLGDTQMSKIIVPTECDKDNQNYNDYDCFSFIVYNFMLGSIQPYTSGVAHIGRFMFYYKPHFLRHNRNIDMNRLFVDPDPSIIDPNYMLNSSFELDNNFTIDNSGVNYLRSISSFRNDINIGANLTFPLSVNTSSSRFIEMYSLITIVIVILKLIVI